MTDFTVGDIASFTGKLEQAYNGDAGIDIFYDGDKDIRLSPLDRAAIPTGVYRKTLAPGYVILVCPRSGLAFNHGITIVNAPGIIDAGYDGEIKVCLANISHKPYTISPGDKIAQLVIVPCASIKSDGLGGSRESNGFGSSGV